MVDGQRIRETFKTRPEAEMRAQKIRAMPQPQGAAAFTPPMDHRVEAAKSLDKLPYCVLGLFCGFRTDKLNRLAWAGVNIVGRTVTIGPKVAKKRRQRIIPVE